MEFKNKLNMDLNKMNGKTMISISKNLALMFFIGILCIGKLFAATPTAISPTFPNSNGVIHLATSADKQKSLFLSRVTPSEEEVEIPQDVYSDVYLYNADDGSYLNLTASLNLSTSANRSVWANFVDTDQQVILWGTTYTSSSRRIVQSKETYLYDLVSGEINQLDMPGELASKIYGYDIGNNGTSLYLMDDNRALFHFDVKEEEWSELEMPASIEYYCSLSLHAARSSREFGIESSCDDRSFFLMKDSTWTQVNVDTSSGYLTWNLSGDGSTLAYVSDSLEYGIIDISADEYIVTTQMLDERFIDGTGRKYDLNVSNDGAYISFKTQLQSAPFETVDSVDPLENQLAIVDVKNNNLALITTYFAEADFFAYSDQNYRGDDIVFYIRLGEQDRTLYSVPLTDSVFQYNPTESISLSADSTSPLSASLHTGNLEHFGLIERRDPFQLNLKRFVVAAGQNEVDSRGDLTPHKFEYHLTSCSGFLVCNDEVTASTEVTIQDYANKPVLVTEYEESVEGDASTGRLLIKANEIPEGTFVKISKLGDYDFRYTLHNTDHSLQHNLSYNSQYIAQFCKHVSDGLSCGGYSEPLVMQIPTNIAPFAAKPLADFSGVKVAWSVEFGERYRLFRVEEDNEQLVYEGAQSEYVDNENLIGKQIAYRLEACNDVACSSQTSSFFDVERSSSPIDLTNSGIKSGFINILSIKSDYAYDAYKIYRVNESDKSRELVAEVIPSQLDEETLFEDRIEDVSTSFYYIVEACGTNNCSAFVSGSVSGASFPKSEYMPSTPQDIQIDQSTHFLAATVSWSPVDHVDGYRIYVRSSSESRTKTYTLDGGGSSQFRYFYNSVFEDVEISVYSFIYPNGVKNLSYAAFSGIPAVINFSTSDRKLDGELLPVEFTINSAQSYGDETRVSLGWDNHRVFDFYNVHFKSEHDTDFTKLRVPAHRNRSSYTHELEHLTHPVTYTYRVEGCNQVLRECVTFGEPQSIKLIPSVSIPESIEAPALTWSTEKGGVIVTPAIPETFEPTWVVLEAKPSDYHNFNTVYEGTIESDILHVPYYREDSLVYDYQIKLCSYDDGENGYLCTEFSEPVQFEIPQDFLVAPQESISLHTAISNTDEQVEIELHSHSYRHLTNYDYHDEPQTMRIYRGVAEEPLSILHEISLDDIDRTQTTTFYRDTDVEPQQTYRYRINFCNTAGCGTYSDVRGETIPTTEEIPIPAIPRLEQANSYSNDVVVSVISDELAEQFIVRWGAEQSEYTRTEEVTFYNMLRARNQVTLRSIEGSTVHAQVKACNGEKCSEWSDNYHFQVPLEYSEHTEVSGEQWLALGSGYHSNSSWVRKSGRIYSAHGELNVFSGELQFNNWLYLSEESAMTTRIYFSPDPHHNCETLFSQNLRLQGERYAKNLVRLLYTGNGCQDYPELDLFKYYIFSDYSVEPIELSDVDNLLNQWNDVSVSLENETHLTVRVNDSLLLTDDMGSEAEVFQLSHGNWETNYYTSIASIVINGEALPSNLDFSLDAIGEDLQTDLFYPTAFAFENRNPDLVFDVEVRSPADNGLMESVANFQFGRTDTKYAPAFVSGLVENSSQIFSFRRCESETCGPYYSQQFHTRSFRALTRVWPPRRIAQQAANSLRLNVDQNYEYIESYSLLQKSSADTDYSTVQEFDYLDKLQEQEWRGYSNSYDLNITIEDLDPQLTYQFKLLACNRLGCIESNESNDFDVPVDTDGDGIVDEMDPFPNDPNEWQDSDGDGIGNNMDTDDDNDGIPDAVEEQYGLNSLSSYDASHDMDADGYSNLLEYLTGADLDDEADTPLQHGVLISFEENENIEYSVQGNFYHNHWAWHGAKNLSANARETELTIEIPHSVSAGNVIFAISHWSDVTVELSLDEEVVSLGNNHTVVENSWDVHSIAIDEKATKAKLSVRFSSSSYDGGFGIDAVFIPGSPSGRVSSDFNGDGKTDLAVRNRDNFTNYTKELETGEIGRIVFGRDAGDIPVEGDFDGDGKTDIAVRRSANFMWYIKRSSDGVIERHQFGKHEDDIPVPADYDGDGKTDLAVRRSSNQMWYIKRSSDGEIERHNFGKQATDIPVPADYDGDGKADIAVRRAADHMWYIKRSSDGKIERHNFGKQATDIAVPADYDGDGKADIAVRRAADLMWYIKQSTDGLIRRVKFGLQTTDIPVIGDYDGDGKADIAVRRASSHYWYVLQSSDEEIGRYVFGKNPRYVPLLAPIQMRMEMAEGNYEFIDLAEDTKLQAPDDWFEFQQELSNFEDSFFAEEYVPNISH